MSLCNNNNNNNNNNNKNYRNQKPINQKAELWSPVPMDTTTEHSCTQGWGTLWKREEKDCKDQKHWGACCKVLSPSNIRSHTQKVWPKWLSKCELNKDNVIGYAKADREKPTRSQPYTKDWRQPRKAGEGEVVFPRAEWTNWSPNAKWSALRTYRQEHYRDLTVILRNIYHTHVYMQS